jgi:hypothetical protein
MTLRWKFGWGPKVSRMLLCQLLDVHRMTEWRKRDASGAWAEKGVACWRCDAGAGESARWWTYGAVLSGCLILGWTVWLWLMFR